MHQRQVARSQSDADRSARQRIGASYGLGRRLIAVENVRGLSKANMAHNALSPEVEVNPETFEVRADGRLLPGEPLKVLPMAQRYFLY